MYLYPLEAGPGETCDRVWEYFVFPRGRRGAPARFGGLEVEAPRNSALAETSRFALLLTTKLTEYVCRALHKYAKVLRGRDDGLSEAVEAISKYQVQRGFLLLQS